VTTLNAPAAVVPESRPAARADSTGVGRWGRRDLGRLEQVRRIVWVFFALQLVFLFVWSAYLYSRYSITNDGGQFIQGVYVIAHGHLAGPSSLEGHTILQDHFTLAWWPLSISVLLWPHALILMWVQDLAMVAAEVVALRWVYTVLSERRPDQFIYRWWPQAVLALVGLALVLNPWTYEALSFDIHIETFACPFIVAAAFDFSRGRNRRAWILVAITLLFGDVMASWIAGLALSALVAAHWDRGRHLVRTAAILVAVAIAWLVVASLIGGTASVLAVSYGYFTVPPGQPFPNRISDFQLLRGVVLHPWRGASVFWGHRLNVVADVSTTGWIGIFTPWTIGVPLVVILVNNISEFGHGVFSTPHFQSAPVYEFSAAGLGIVLAWLGGTRFRLRSWLPAVVATLVAINVVVWPSFWLPQLPSTWVRISSAQAAVLSKLNGQIPASDEVVVSQGVLGRFSERLDVHDLVAGNNHVPVSGATVWFIVVPNAGIETQSVSGAFATIGRLASPLGATLVSASHGVWAYRWHRPAAVHSLVFVNKPSTIPAWPVAGKAGTSERFGPVRDWHTAATGRQGYIISGDYWKRQLGTYNVSVRLSTATTVYIEVWNVAGHLLLARDEVPATNGPLTVEFPVNVAVPFPLVTGYAGWGPFSIQPVYPEVGQTLDVRVYGLSGAIAGVYSVSVAADTVQSQVGSQGS
jgi:hypothetical protein